MALKGSQRRVDEQGETPQAQLSDTGFAMSPSGQLEPIRLPEIMPSLRIRQMTPFGNMHVKVAVDPASGREREVFAQLGKGGDVANSDLEAVCRLLSLWLRSGGTLDMALKQLEGIGSSLTVPTRDGRIMSLADGLARALKRYQAAKEEAGLHALLLGGAEPVAQDSLQPQPRPASKGTAPSKAPRNTQGFKVKCPACSANLAFQEGCVKCHSCGFSQC
jgi:ribonucleoside-diphosphate reductase alpha chain